MDRKDDIPADETFLGRWSRRKRAEPEKREIEDSQVQTEQQSARAADTGPSPAANAGPTAVPADLPAIGDLTHESDFGRFMKPDVPMASRNAAMKKLFTDPHYNVMDGLDIYIDDYTKEDPIPESMLRDLAQSRMLKLFNYDKEDAEDAEKARLAKLAADLPDTIEVADAGTPDSMSLQEGTPIQMSQLPKLPELPELPGAGVNALGSGSSAIAVVHAESGPHELVHPSDSNPSDK